MPYHYCGTGLQNFTENIRRNNELFCFIMQILKHCTQAWSKFCLYLVADDFSDVRYDCQTLDALMHVKFLGYNMRFSQ